MELSIPRLAKQIPTEAAAYEFLEQLRWNGEPVCPHCGVIGDHKFLTPRNGISRETNRGKQSERRVWKCCECKRQFSVLTGTVMHGSHVPVRTWLFIMFEMVANKNGLAAREVERKYDLHPKTAWFLLHRIREAMTNGSPMAQMAGTIMADETFFGGKPSNRHGFKKGQGQMGRPATLKTPILTLVNKETGEARSQIVANVKPDTLSEAIRATVDVKNSALQTDAFKGYIKLGQSFKSHDSVNHSVGEYARGPISTNAVEGYFSQFKSSVQGTHHHISVGHLPRYLAEFDFRYSTRDESDTMRMERLIGRTAGKRLSYKAPTSLEQEPTTS